MDTIKTYLENMFANLPKTNQMLKIKNDLLLNMEEKYIELKKDGKSENEAIGIVISEFGNIDELVSELGLEYNKTDVLLPTLTQEEANNFLAAKKQSGLLVGIGVSLCILAAALLILINTLTDDGIIFKNLSKDITSMLGLITFFIILVPAIALFIYSGMKLEKYNYLKNDFDLPFHVKTMVQQKYDVFASSYMFSIIVGVCLCVLSPVAIFITSAFGGNGDSYGITILLIMVSLAVFIFIYYGNTKESFTILLKTPVVSEVKAEDNKVIGAVASIVWPLAACIFLISGFIFHKWSMNWIVFPVTGILFGMFSAAYSIIKGHNN